MNIALPAIIAAAAALVTAAVSSTIAIYALRQASRDRAEAQSQRIAEQLLPRRLDAYERMWSGLIKMQETGEIPPATADDLVAASIWLPDTTRRSLLLLLSSDESQPELMGQVRELLLSDAAVRNIDRSMDILAGTMLGRQRDAGR